LESRQVYARCFLLLGVSRFLRSPPLHKGLCPLPDHRVHIVGWSSPQFLHMLDFP
jgi:hypothetical protein